LHQRDGKRDVIGGSDGKPGSTREEYFHGPVRDWIPGSLDHGWNQGKSPEGENSEVVDMDDCFFLDLGN
jgi:hypothetical protein